MMFNRRYRHNHPPQTNYHSQGRDYIRQHSQEKIPKQISARQLIEDDSRKQVLKISNRKQHSPRESHQFFKSKQKIIFNQKRSNSRLILKPIPSTTRNNQKEEIYEALKQLKQSEQLNIRIIKQQLCEKDVEEQFYRQVRLQQQFKKLSRMIN